MAVQFDPDKLETTIKILRNKGLGHHADLVSLAAEEIRVLQSTPLPRKELKPLLDKKVSEEFKTKMSFEPHFDPSIMSDPVDISDSEEKVPKEEDDSVED